MVSMISSAVSSLRIATEYSLIRLVASGPIMCAPRISSYSTITGGTFVGNCSSSGTVPVTGNFALTNATFSSVTGTDQRHFYSQHHSIGGGSNHHCLHLPNGLQRSAWKLQGAGCWRHESAAHFFEFSGANHDGGDFPFLGSGSKYRHGTGGH